MIDTILITGCTRGIGRALAVRLAEKNCHVYAVGRDEKSLTTLAKSSPHITPILADITNEAGRRNLKVLLKQERHLSIIHNAAIAIPNTFKITPEEELRAHFETNYIAPMLITQALLPLLKTQRVLHISSGAAEIALPGLTHYCATKAALQHATQCLNAELNKENIYFSTLRPGMVDTSMQTALREANQETLPNRDYYVSAKEQGELFTPEQVANFAAPILLKTDNIPFAETKWNIHEQSHHLT